MGKLRKTVQKEVYDALDSSIFSSDDFDIEFGDPEDSESLVYITFLHDNDFSYTINVTGEYNDSYYVNKSPGNIQESDSAFHATFIEAVDAIPSWCNEIRNELKASKLIYKEVDELRIIIEEQFTKVTGNDDEFSVSEINELHSKFSALLKRVEQLEKDKIITEKQLKEFSSGITQVSDDLEFYPKKTWLKTSANKIVKLVASIGKSTEGRKILADGARKLLGLE